MTSKALIGIFKLLNEIILLRILSSEFSIFAFMKREIIVTADGSKTIHLPELNENYHSHHGALQEALHVFIKHGLEFMMWKKDLNVLEVGFGTGLNALLSFDFARKNDLNLYYQGLEAYPISREEISSLDYISLPSLKELEKEYLELHNVVWNEKVLINSNFILSKVQQKLQDFLPESGSIDLIFFDAFGPRVQEELWSVEIFEKLFNAMNNGGVLVTYCAKGQVKRNMKAAGFTIEALPGPPGKREMTRAVKN